LLGADVRALVPSAARPMTVARASSPGRVAAAAPPRPTSLRARVARALFGVALLAAVGVFAWQLARFEQRRLTLDGVALPSGDAEPFVRALAADWHATELTLDAGSRVVRASRYELGGRLDVERAVREVRAARGSAPIWERALAMATGRSGQLTFAREVRTEDTHAFVARLRELATVEPVAAAYEGEG